NFEPSIANKWLGLLKRVAPNIRRIAYLFNPNHGASVLRQGGRDRRAVVIGKAVCCSGSQRGRDGPRNRPICSRIRWRAPGAAGPLHRNESSIDHRARRPAPPAGGLSVPLLRLKRRPDFLWY